MRKKQWPSWKLSKKWRHDFLGNKLIIRTDQRSLKYLASQKLLEGIQHKLMLKLLEFDYVIEYKKGIDNQVADALSRKYQQKEECVPADAPKVNHAISVAVPYWVTKITASYTGDDTCVKLLQELTMDPTSHPKYSLQSLVLRYKGRIYIGTIFENLSTPLPLEATLGQELPFIRSSRFSIGPF
jgi:hypothetical protein